MDATPGRFEPDRGNLWQMPGSAFGGQSVSCFPTGALGRQMPRAAIPMACAHTVLLEHRAWRRCGLRPRRRQAAGLTAGAALSTRLTPALPAAVAAEAEAQRREEAAVAEEEQEEGLCLDQPEGTPAACSRAAAAVAVDSTNHSSRRWASLEPWRWMLSGSITGGLSDGLPAVRGQSKDVDLLGLSVRLQCGAGLQPGRHRWLIRLCPGPACEEVAPVHRADRASSSLLSCPLSVCFHARRRAHLLCSLSCCPLVSCCSGRRLNSCVLLPCCRNTRSCSPTSKWTWTH